MARVTARFVAESEKVTFDVKYFRPEASSTSYAMGAHGVSGHPDTAGPNAGGMDGEATHRVSPIRNLAGLLINGQLQLVL